MQAKDDETTESAVIRVKFPNANNGIAGLQLFIPRAGDGALQAQILFTALEDANKERRKLLSTGNHS